MKNKILLVSSSLQCTDSTPVKELEKLVREKLGMEVVFTDSLMAPSYSPLLPENAQEDAGKLWYHHVGRPEDRANQMAGINWDEIACVWNIKGIVGGAQTADALADLLDKKPEIIAKLRENNIPVVGYSDFTHITNLFVNKGVPIIYGVGASNYLDPDKYGGVPYPNIDAQLQEFRSVITGAVTSTKFERVIPLNPKAIKSGGISGQVLGGYTDVVASTVGTPRGLEHAPDKGGVILFLEGPCSNGENTLQEQFDHILASDLRVEAVVFGDVMDMQKFEDDRNAAATLATLTEVAESDRLRDVPFYYGLPVGHTKDDTRVLPMGTAARLSRNEDGTFSLTVDTHKKQREQTRELKDEKTPPRLIDRLVLKKDILYSANVTASHLMLDATNDAAKQDKVLMNKRIVSCDLLKERNFTGTSAALDMTGNPVLMLNINAIKTAWPVRAIVESLNSLRAAGVLEKASAIIIGNVKFPDMAGVGGVLGFLDRADTTPFKEGFQYFLENTFRDYGLSDIPILQARYEHKLPEGRFRQQAGATLALGHHAVLTGIQASEKQRVTTDVIVMAR